MEAARSGFYFIYYPVSPTVLLLCCSSTNNAMKICDWLAYLMDNAACVGLCVTFEYFYYFSSRSN